MADIDDCVTAESAHGNRVALKSCGNTEQVLGHRKHLDERSDDALVAQGSRGWIRREAE